MTKRRLRQTIFAAWVVALGVSTFGERVCRAEESAESMAEAKRQFQAGVNLLDDPDGAKYEEAYGAFKRAYELSQSPKVLGNLGFCALHLERDGEAVDAYSAYLREVPDIDDKERGQIQKDIATLTSTLARYKVVVKEPGKDFVLVDTRVQTRGAPVVNTYAIDASKELTVRIRPGRHTFKVKNHAGESAPFEAVVEPGSQGAHDFVFPPPAPIAKTVSPADRRPPTSHAGPIIVGGIGLAAIGAGVVTGILARGKTNDLEAKCPNDVCPREYDFAKDKDQAKTFSTVADISFIGGGVLLGSAFIWYLLQPKGGSSQSGSAPAAQWVSAGCTGQGCGVELRRGF